MHEFFEQVNEIALKCGRNPNEIKVVAVTKYSSIEECVKLYDAGFIHFGESKCLEALEKQKLCGLNCKWHLIGHLQSNKVKKAIGNFSLIHSVDTVELAKKIAACSQERQVTTSILLQVNTSRELSKSGLLVDEWKRQFEMLVGLEGVSIEGLMTMAPLNGTETEIRQCFSVLRNLKDELQTASGLNLPHLSMGMSDDYKIAIQEGATLLRIGRALKYTQSN